MASCNCTAQVPDLCAKLTPLSICAYTVLCSDIASTGDAFDVYKCMSSAVAMQQYASSWSALLPQPPTAGSLCSRAGSTCISSSNRGSSATISSRVAPENPRRAPAQHGASEHSSSSSRANGAAKPQQEGNGSRPQTAPPPTRLAVKPPRLQRSIDDVVVVSAALEL